MIAEGFYTCASEIGLEFNGNYDKNFWYIGLSPQSIKENETLREFGNRIIQDLAEIGIQLEFKDLGWYSECWYDG